MERKFLLLTISLLVSVAGFAQRETTDAFALQQELRSGERKWPTEWPDSIIGYSFAGKKLNKQEFFNGGDEEISYNYYSWQLSHSGYVKTNKINKNEYDIDPYIEVGNESNPRLSVRLTTISSWYSLMLSNDSNNLPSVIKYNDSGQLIYAEGTQLSVRITYNERGQISTVIQNDLEDNYEKIHQYQYDNNGNLIAYLSNGHSEYASYDLQGRISRIYHYYHLTTPEPEFEANSYSVYYYSDGYSPTVEPEAITPIGDTNQGSFDLNTTLSIDSIHNASFVVQLPDGFTLDESNTSLTINFAELFDLTITKQENNSWLFEVTPKTPKSAVLRADDAGQMLHIAYNVDEYTKKEIYDIVINNIRFETPSGNLLPEPAITVPISVNRWATGIEKIETSNTVVYLVNHALYIQTLQAEQVTVYTVNGSLVYKSTVSSGTTTIDANAFPQGVLIVQGSSGWIKKVVMN